MMNITTIWVKKKSVRKLRLALIRKNGSTSGITDAASRAIEKEADSL